MDRIRRLDNPVRDYDWGSRTAIAEIQGRPSPAPGPEAELWMGAHPTAPSRVSTDDGPVALPEWIARDPEAVLGRQSVARFGPVLPFLLKVLAAERPLSIQTHPDAAAAAEGFARENAQGVPPGAPERCYPDPNPKPEILCALTPFAALCGFRPAAAIADDLAALGGAPALAPVVHALRSAEGGLEAAFRMLWSGTPADRAARVAAAITALRRGYGDPDRGAAALALAEDHPDDVGVLAPYLFNRVVLEPGDALFLAAGELHAYLGGVGVELMASSDNVLRAGLTAKHVDASEVLRRARFASAPPAILGPRAAGPAADVYDAPTDWFELSVLRPEAGRPFESAREHPAEILFCAEGEAAVAGGARGDSLSLPRGGAVLVPAAAAGYRVTGRAVVYRARVAL